ncbi:phosphate/phosphite/phosphonate ABC transporter substrate-binding protein [Endothiovibrio diazotrophicus]
MSKKVLGLIAVLVFVLGFTPAAYPREIKIGVLAPRGKLKAVGRWQEFGHYLSTELGKPVTLVPLTSPRVIEAVDGHAVDYLFSHSPDTVYVEEKLGATVLATLDTPAGPRLAGVIIAKKGSGIRRAVDLRGKKVVSLKINVAAGAYIFQAYHLLQQGIDPRADFAALREAKKQDDLVLAVNNGLFDAAFVRTGLLESMQREGKIKLDDFEIVDRRSDDGFPLLHTTALYPEWGFAALPGATDTDAVKAALFKLKADMPAAQRAHIVGFVEPVSLDGLKAALKALHIAPYN